MRLADQGFRNPGLMYHMATETETMSNCIQGIADQGFQNPGLVYPDQEATTGIKQASLSSPVTHFSATHELMGRS